MPNPTVVSPAGQEIPVVPDADLVAAGVVEKDLRMFGLAKRPIVEALWSQGPIEDSGGRATAILHERAKALGYKGAPSAINGVFKGTVFTAITDRKINGKRCSRIELTTLPASYAAVLTEHPSRNGHKVMTVEPTGPKPVADASPVEPEVKPEPVLDAYQPEPPSEDIAQMVARNLLAEVVRIAKTGGPDGRLAQLESDLRLLQQRLAQATEFGEKQRRLAREAADELGAVKAERDGLRMRLRSAEHNLQQALGADGRRYIDGQVTKAIDQVMREAPKAHAS